MFKSMITPVFALSAMLWVMPAHAHDMSHQAAPKMRTLPVTASASVTSEPDQALVTAAVITEGKDAAKVSAENAQKMTAVYAAMAQAGIPRSDIKTSQLSLTPRYDYESRKKPRIVGYTANNTVSVKTYDLSKVSTVVDSFVQAGANNISNVQFSLRDPEAVETQVLDKAISKARRKAQAIANSAGITLGTLQSLTSDGGGHVPYNRTYDEVIVTSSGGGSGGGSPVRTPISYGNHTVKATVQLVFEMR